MLKKYAISTMNAYYGETLLNNGNTRFANLNRAKAIWRFDIPLEKIDGEVDSTLHLVVFDPDRNELHHLAVPSQYVRDNLQSLVVRTDNKCISLEFSAIGNKFRDVRPRARGTEFGQFLQATLCIVALTPSRMQSIQN